jgi:hypothetical protein
MFLDRSINRFKELKETLKQNGIEVENDEDIFAALNMSDEGVALHQILDKAN